MLAKLILIKACTYDLAELDFSQGDSMQLVGGNNVGKSSLIYALNFLFVINRKRMSFMGRKPADKTTMEYYFPTAEGSFLIFEISKRGRKYCLLVWRDGDGSPGYARIDHAYERDLFFDTSEAGLIPLSLTQLRRHWLLRSIKVRELKNNPDIFKQVYHTGRANDAVVWLRSSGHGRGAEGFSKLYRYLIDTRLIDDTALREILLLADHRSEERLSYGNANLSDIERLRRLKSRVDLLRQSEERFDRFRTGFRRLQEDQTELNDLAEAFRFRATALRAEIETDRIRYQADLAATQEGLSVAQRELESLHEQIGALKSEQQATRRQGADLEQRHAAIRALPTAEFLETSRDNLRQRIETRQFQLTDLGQSALTAAELERRINRADAEIAQLQQQLDNIAEWLLFRLSADPAERRLLHAILSPAVARLDAAALRREISSTERLVTLFDGAFQLPPDFVLPDLPTPEQLRQEIEEHRERRDRDQRLLAAARNREDWEKELADLKRQAQETSDQLRQLAEAPELREQIEANQATLAQQETTLTQLTQQARERREECDRRSAALELIKDKQRKRDSEEQRLLGWLGKLEGFDLPAPAEAVVPPAGSEADPGRLFAELERRQLAYRELSHQNRSDFSLLRRDLLLETADEAAFIEEVEQEYIGLDDQEKVIGSLVDNIGQHFANPAGNFLHQYQLFQDFINQQFNRSLARLHISNIESLRIELVPNESLQRDLHNISQLDLSSGSLFGKERGGLTVLRRYIEQGKDIAFSDLFSLQLKLTIAGREKTVDLSKQVESDGTDRMLRLVIVMQVISRLVDLSPENRIVMFIDEIATIDGKNRPQLVDFCREHHFYPIFAAPEMVEGFDRYVLISRGADKRLVVEEDKHYVDVERD